MRSHTFSKKTKAAVLAGVLTVGIAGGAYAYWTNTGTGTGSASTGTNAAITVNQTSSSDSALYPGGPATTLAGNFTNPNSSKVYVATVSVALHAFSSQTDVSKPACTESDFQINTASVPVGAEVDAGSAKGSWSGLKVSLKDTGANQDNCKSVTLPLDFTSN